MRSADLSRTTQRIAWVRVALLAGLVLLSGRAAQLATDPRADARVRGQVDGQLRIRATRGEIQDRSGRQLAASVDAPSVYVVPGEVADPAGTAARLARVLHMPVARVRARLAHPSPFVFVARWVSEATKEQVLALGLAGVGVVPEPKRLYPLGDHAGTVVGFMNIDEVGVRGIEQQEQAWLQGTLRDYPVERDARGQKLPQPGVDPRATVGGDVRLTLDGAMQATAEQALQAAVERHQAAGGAVVALDPRTGDVLAQAEWPRFDPNRFRKTAFSASRARTFSDALEPGSVMKTFLLAGALEHAAVSIHELIECENGTFRVPGKTIHDHEPHDRLDLAGILAQSSNIGATKVAYRLGAERHFQVLRAFGFGGSSGSGFPGESAGLLRSWERWRPVDQANIAFGQGINVTAIQLAAATAALASGGIWRTPRLVAARRPPGGPWTPEKPGETRRVVRSETAGQVLHLMEGVVTQGTGRLAGLHGVRVAGKTGTAQKLDREAGRYHEDRFVAWFIGVVPADDPRLVIVAAVDDPQGLLHTGGSVAAPLFAEVAAGQLLHMGIYTRPEPIPRAVAGLRAETDEG